MADFSAITTRPHPYRNFKFRVMWDGRYVAGVSKVSGLKLATKLTAHHKGAEHGPSFQFARELKYKAILQERGITHDPEFEKWAGRVRNAGSGLEAEVSLRQFRRDLVIESYHESGQLTMSSKVFRCRVSEYQTLPELDAGTNAVAIEMIKLENEGWEPDEKDV